MTTADHDAIVQLTFRYATGIDRRDWALYETCFADPCEFDFSSFSGRPAEPMSPSAFAARVEATNGSFDATQHLMSNHVVTFSTPDRARAVYELQAQHWFSQQSMADLGAPSDIPWCLLGGHYDADVERIDGQWRFRRLTLNVRWHTGNMGVFLLARARGAARRS